MIRQARISDFRQCLGIALAYLETHCNPNRELVASDVADHIGKDDKCFLVLEEDKLIKGIFYGYIDHNVFTGERFARERIVFIAPDSRTPATFEQFVSAFDNWAKEKGCEFTRFFALGSENNEALTRLMVSRFGFAQIGYVLEKKYE